MAVKAIYLYQVTMGHGNKQEGVSYCYARNAGVAVDEIKKIYAEKKYDSFSAKMFGDADVRIHSKPFELMSPEEVKYITENGLAKEEKYAQQKSTFQTGEFVSKEEADKLLKEGEVS